MSFTKTTTYKLLLKATTHLLFWTVVFIFYNYFFGYGSDIENFGYSFALVLMPITIAITYLIIYNLIPKFLLKKRYLKFTLYLIYTIIVSSYLIYISIFYGMLYLSKAQLQDMPIASKNIIFIMVGVYLIVFLASGFKLMQLQLKSVEQKNTLEQKVLAAQLKLKEQELNYLKMQIHPHFLFNTLNTMYGFALQKAEETPEMILKLSNLLDYLLYQVDKPLVPLEEEINHIKDYITLEKMRFSEKLDVTITEKRESKHTTIAPMILLPFVENSFKHGALKDGKLKVNITIHSNSETIKFKIENNSKTEIITNHGIGLDNIKKRLELLYKNQYSLDIININSVFKVELRLNQLTTNA